MLCVNDSMFDSIINFLLKVSIFSGSSGLGFCVLNAFICLQPSEVSTCHCNSISMQLNLPVLWEGDIALINVFFLGGGGGRLLLCRCIAYVIVL